jgi:enoyl-CoA hydratase
MISAKEVERIGLVSKLSPEGKSLEEAIRVAKVIARGPQHAIRHSKRALNIWLQQNGSSAFDVSCALEFLDFQHRDVTEGIASLQQKRSPVFLSSKL